MSRRRPSAPATHRAFIADSAHTAAGQRTRGLTEGAILAALTAVIAAAGLVIPPVAILLAPLPIMLLVIRWGLRTGVLATIVAGLILMQFLGPLVASLALGFGPVGLALGWGVRNERGPTWTVLAGAAAFYASTLVSLALAMAVLHQDVLAQFIRLQTTSMQHSIALMERLGASPQMVEPLRLLTDAPCGEHHCLMPPLEAVIRSTGLVVLALAALIWGYLCYMVGRSLLRRLGYQIPALPPMLTWRLPRQIAASLVWLSAGLSLAGLWVPALAGLTLSAVFLNLLVFGFLGALVAVTWMTKRQIPRFAQAAVLLFLITSQSALPLLALAVLGMLDTWHDFRRLTSTSPPPTGQDNTDGRADQGPALPAAAGIGGSPNQKSKAVSRP